MASVAGLNLDHISEFIERQKESNLVKERIRRNADRNLPEMSMDRDATDHTETLDGGNVVVPH